MANDTGRGRWPEERPTRASVRRLHGDAAQGSSAADQAQGSSATATGEWYETERLAGQITGGRTAAPAFSQAQAAAVLDWRHAELAPAPTALQRLGRSLADRGHSVVSLFVGAGHRRHGLAAGARDADVRPQTQPRRRRLAMLATRAVAPPKVEAQEDKPTADAVLAAEPSSPQPDPRGSAELAPQRLGWRSGPAPKASRERRPRPWGRGLIGTALVLTAAAVPVIAITSSTNGRAVGSQARTATSRPGVALIAAAKTMIGVLGTVERRARTTPTRRRIIARRALRRRRPDHNARHSRPVRPQASSPAPQAPAASPAPQAPATSQATNSSAGGGSASSTPVSSSRTSAAGSASSSQSTSPAAAAAASQSQPAGPTGPAAILGPGRCSC
jgi:hypothetical protein